MNSAGLQLTILGSGTSTGVPVLGCHCPVCRSDEPRNRRTRCSVLLAWAGRQVLIDTATDFRQQALREGIERLDAVLFTHTHADHVHGIDDLRTLNPAADTAIPVYASARSLATIRRAFAYIFSDEAEPGYRPRLQLHQIDGPFELFGQPVVPIPLEHGGGLSLGFRVAGLAYLTDCSGIPPESWALLAGLDLLVIDALRFREHASHLNIAAAIAIAGRLGARRTLLTHLSHDVDYRRHSGQLPDGIEFAYDGQSLELPLTGC
ncbi:MAG: GPMC system MBL fold metallohydrolase [Desulfuromonadales bacterium]|nr:GPMC system MBL fold metallohydrolase [Desulfuromonadales bacterium]